MPSERLPLEQAKLVTPRALKAYAEALGWRVVQGVNGTIALYHRPDSDLHQLTVPLNENFDDYAETVVQAVRKLAAYEVRPALEVLDHLLLPPADELRFREVSPEAEAGNLSLLHAARLITGTQLRLARRRAQRSRRQALPSGMSRSEAEEFIAGCRMGQTERGSFTLTIACPLDLPQAPNDEPFARRVTNLFMHSLEGLAQATDSSRLAELADLTRHPGLSANFCEVLAMIRPEGERSYLSIAATWSRAYLPELAAGQDGANAKKLLTSLRHWDRNCVHCRRRELDRFFGYVDVLKATSTDPRPSGEVRFVLFDKEEEINAWAPLNPEDFQKAGQAPLTTDLITFTGILERLARGNRIKDLADFEALEFDQDGIQQKNSGQSGVLPEGSRG